MNYKKVIKDLKERNNKLQEQYRLRDIRCIHLEYENEMLKGDFEAQHELTKKYAKENQELKRQLHEASIQIQELIEKDIWCPSNCEKLKKLQQENKKQKEVIDKIMNLIKQYGKYDGKKCTRGFQMWSADFNKILDMLKEVSE